MQPASRRPPGSVRSAGLPTSPNSGETPAVQGLPLRGSAPSDAGTIFYNPMRILRGSIAMVDEGDETGITSPDYVVLKTWRSNLPQSTRCCGALSVESSDTDWQRQARPD